MSHRSHYPRPEYPRPDKQRGLQEGLDWINLNGPWQFRFDGARRGLEEEWFRQPPGEWHEQILVPFCWESLAAWGEGNAASSDHYYSPRIFLNPLEVTRANHRVARRYEIGWYRREVAVPPGWREGGRRVILHVGAADFFTDCWCNGEHMGSHEGGYTPFEFDLTGALDSDGRGVIVFRVEDPFDNHEQPVGKQWQWYTTTSGIWQTVFLEPRSPAYVERFRITTEIGSGGVNFEIVCHGAEEGAPLEVVITSPVGGDDLTAETLEVRDGVARGSVTLSPPRLWRPDEPFLYRVRLHLHGAPEAPDDLVRTYFGIREISTRPVERPDAPAALCLNGRPIYLRGALYQSYYPDGVYTAWDAQTLSDDILYAKRVGFDFLRIHLKLDDPLLLYYADTLGILLMEDFPNFGEGGDTPLGRRRFETMMREGIERDFNHPSIIAWCLFNETWGFGGQVELVKHFGPNAHALLAERDAMKIENRSAQQWVQKMWELAKSLDRTRLVEDMSVVHWEHLHYYAHGDTDINSWHFYIDSYEKAKAHIETVVKQTYAGSQFNYSEGYAQGNQPLINSEYGGIGALDGDRDISWSFKFLTNELRLHGSLSAYIYTELHDVEWETNGFLNYDRTPKEFGYDPKIINQGDVLPINAPPIRQCPPGEAVSLEVYVSHYSRRRPNAVTLHWRLSGIDTMGRIFQDVARGRQAIPFRPYQVDLAAVVPLVLPREVMLCTFWAHAVSDDGEVLATNFVQFFVSPPSLPRREEEPGRVTLRAHVADWVAAAWSGGFGDPAEAAERGRCYGLGSGYFEWELPIAAAEFARARRLRILCEASARRRGYAQTDSQRTPTTFELLLNGTRVHRSILPDHPHDTRGALSHLSGGYGGYGYLAQLLAEGELLDAIRANSGGGPLRLTCRVPEDAPVEGGLTIYGTKSGRYPICPTVIAEW